METISNSAPWIALILGYGTLTHGIIFLNDGLYWDGWLVDLWQQNKDSNSMRRFYSEVGMPSLYLEHWTVGRFPRRHLAYRTISFFSLLLMAVSVFLTAVHTNAFDPLQASVISLLLLSYPAYAVTFDGVVSLQYTFKVALFYAGCFLALTTVNAFDGIDILVFALSLALFLIAFNANSLLVYFCGFLLYYAWVLHTTSPDGLDARELAKLLSLTVLPLAYWFIKEAYAPRHGYYDGYNRIRVTPLSLLRVGLLSFRHGIDVPMIKPILELIRSKNTFLLVAGVLLGSFVHEISGNRAAMPALEALQIVVTGYALLFLGAAPFMLVGQSPAEGGWASKNLMLFHLPFAMVVFGWLQFVPSSYGIALIPVILLANTLYIVKTHLLYIAVSVKDKALVQWLKANAQLSTASVIKIRDLHWMAYPFERKETMFRPAYLSCMVKRIWPDSRILAILDNWGTSARRALTPAEIEQALEDTTIRYSFAPQVQTGPQYLVTITAPVEGQDAAGGDEGFDDNGDVDPSKQRIMIKMALEYLFLKWISPDPRRNLFGKYFAFSASKL